MLQLCHIVLFKTCAFQSSYFKLTFAVRKFQRDKKCGVLYHTSVRENNLILSVCCRYITMQKQQAVIIKHQEVASVVELLRPLLVKWDTKCCHFDVLFYDKSNFTYVTKVCFINCYCYRLEIWRSCTTLLLVSTLVERI